ncbi:hypothetical protein [Streptococcus equi]|uniref:AAA family ATPase n=1 Tax=Streptococcus equi TaxID=1336 RepID=UPI0039C60920
MIWHCHQSPIPPIWLWTLLSRDLRQHGHLPIPRHLRDGHYPGSKELGNAQHYLYPHAYPEKWVKQQYLPDQLVKKNYFDPNETGKYERALAANKARIDKLSSS